MVGNYKVHDYNIPQYHYFHTNFNKNLSYGVKVTVGQRYDSTRLKMQSQHEERQ